MFSPTPQKRKWLERSIGYNLIILSVPMSSIRIMLSGVAAV